MKFFIRLYLPLITFILANHLYAQDREPSNSDNKKFQLILDAIKDNNNSKSETNRNINNDRPNNR